MKLHKSKRKTNRKIGGVLKDDDIFRFKEGKYVYDDQNVEKQYSTLKNTLKLSPPSEPNLAKDFFKNNNDLLRNIFEYSMVMGKRIKVIKQLIKKYPKLEKVIKHFLGYTNNTSKYFDLTEVPPDGNLEYEISFAKNVGIQRGFHNLPNVKFQRHLDECLQIYIINQFFKILNDESIYTEPENATTSQINTLKLEIAQLSAFITVSIYLKENVKKNQKDIGLDDISDEIISEEEPLTSQYSINVTYYHFKKGGNQNGIYLPVSKEILADCKPPTPKTTPKTTRKRKQYTEATRKSTRNRR